MATTVIPLPSIDPSPRDVAVGRERLIRRLEVTGARVILLRAPAGYGKSTLLHAWSRRGGRPFHWLSPGRRLRAGDGCVLIRDGWPAAAQGDVAAAVARLPAGSRLVIATRSAVGLGRLRAQHDVLELGAADLALTRREAAAALQEAGAGLRLAERDALLARLEGWPALVSLAEQSLARGASPRDIDAGDPMVAEYLADEVLEGLPDRLRAFLLRTAILDDLDAGLCDAVLGVRQSAAVLHELERGPLPIWRVNGAGPALRCHPLLRDALRAELRRREPLLERDLRRRASAALEERGDLPAAIDQAVAGEDAARVGALLWRDPARLAWAGRGHAVACWVAALPPRAPQRHATIALTVALTAVPSLAVSRIDRSLAQAGAAADQTPPELERSVRATTLALSALVCSGPVAELRGLAAGARAAGVAGEPAHTLACLMGGTGALLAGDRGAATEWLEDGARHAGAAAPLVAALCDAELALDALFEGDDAAGWLRAQRARARLGGAEPAGEDLPAALVLAVVALAGVARGHAQEARADADAAATLLAGRDTIPPWFAAQVSVALALALLRLSDVRAAREHLAVARRAASRLPDAPLLARWIAETTASLSALGTALTAAGAVLTPAELRVLHALPSHRTYREIGESFVVSGNTIKSQAHAVYRKLGVASRSAAVRRAIELGLVDDHV